MEFRFLYRLIPVFGWILPGSGASNLAFLTARNWRNRGGLRVFCGDSLVSDALDSGLAIGTLLTRTDPGDRSPPDE